MSDHEKAAKWPDDEAGLTEKIVTRIQAGDEKSFEDLFRRYRERIGVLVAARIPRWLSLRVEIEDILQEIWLRAFRQFRSFQPQGSGSFRRWIRTIALNYINDLLRGQKAKKRDRPGKRLLSLDGATSSSAITLAERIAGSTRTPSKRLWAKENVDRVVLAVEALPDSHRRVITLRYLMGLSVAEAARRLAMTEAAVKMATLRGLQELARTFRKEGPPL